MKSIIALVIACAAALQAQDQPLAVIPQPVEMSRLSGEYVLEEKTTIRYDAPAARSVGEMLARKLSVPTGYALRAEAGSGGSVQLRLAGTEGRSMGEGGLCP